MDALEMLYDHYKETFSLSKEAQARRNKSFIVLCILEAFSFLLLIRPEKYGSHNWTTTYTTENQVVCACGQSFGTGDEGIQAVAIHKIQDPMGSECKKGYSVRPIKISYNICTICGEIE